MKPLGFALRGCVLALLRKSLFSQGLGEVGPIEVGDAVPFTPQVGQEAGDEVGVLYDCPLEAPCRLEIGKAFGDPWVKTTVTDVKYFQVRGSCWTRWYD